MKARSESGASTAPDCAPLTRLQLHPQTGNGAPGKTRRGDPGACDSQTSNAARGKPVTSAGVGRNMLRPRDGFLSRCTANHWCPRRRPAPPRRGLPATRCGSPILSGPLPVPCRSQEHSSTVRQRCPSGGPAPQSGAGLFSICPRAASAPAEAASSRRASGFFCWPRRQLDQPDGAAVLAVSAYGGPAGRPSRSFVLAALKRGVSARLRAAPP